MGMSDLLLIMRNNIVIINMESEKEQSNDYSLNYLDLKWIRSPIFDLSQIA